ncbi:MAG: molybdopterin-dependent oxidoreductase, partial [Betaproteobacteria bacterium]|nr:molybdopterin-dependent oxidoreductase [Betaproteobacteria bacterium]
DPRRTETAEFADLHLPILPGTDVALFHAMLHAMLWEEWIDRDYIDRHTEGFEALRTLVREMSPALAAGLCGVKAEDIVTAARWFAQSAATLSLYCQGLNQSSSGTAKNATLINLHLATGQIGKPGAGPFSLTGQPNAMGGREVGGMATTLAAHRDLSNPAHRAQMQALWGVDRLSEQRGKTAVEMFEAVKSGEIKLVWIACTNPAQSLPNLAHVHEALNKAELVVVQEAYRHTETTAFADVLLPAASWGEKEGTVTNSERRISRVRAAVRPPGEARADWIIARDFARRLEAHLRPGRASLFGFDSAEAVWNEHRATTRGRDLDITGLSYAILESRGPQQWPFPAGAPGGTARLYADGVFATPSGRARFAAMPYRAMAEKTDARYPLSLTTGRLRDHWHAMSRTGTVARLFGHAGEPCLLAHAGDLARRGIADGDLVTIESRRGAVVVRAAADRAMRSGQVDLPMHWGARFLGGQASAGVNTLTVPAFDPVSRQPELKHAAVKVSRADLAWHLVAFARGIGADAERFEALTPLGGGVAFFSRVLIGRESPGMLVRAAHAGAPAAAWIAALDAALGLDATNCLQYDDLTRGHARRMSITADQLTAVRLSGNADAVATSAWLQEWLVAGKPVAAIRRLLLLPSARAPEGFVAPGRVTCQCHGVGEAAIRSALAQLPGTATERLAVLQRNLKCGTECGSCLPEVKRLVAAIEPAVPAPPAHAEAA